MAQYRVLQRSYINDSIVEEGAIVEFAGAAGSNLELLETPKSPKSPKGPKGQAGAASAFDTEIPEPDLV